MQAEQLVDVFRRAFVAQRQALEMVKGDARRARTERPGQYVLDLVADAAVVPVLEETGARIVSEESGIGGVLDADVTIVVDPVDGSTNCAREIPYWSISICAVDRDGPWCSFVANGATGAEFVAIRGEGAFADGQRVAPSKTTEIERSVIAVSGLPARVLPWRQFRALGSCALTLCEIASGRLDGFIDALAEQHAAWDYLGGALMCREAGAMVVDAHDRPLETVDPAARRQILAAATPVLLDQLRVAVAS